MVTQDEKDCHRGISLIDRAIDLDHIIVLTTELLKEDVRKQITEGKVGLKSLGNEIEVIKANAIENSRILRSFAQINSANNEEWK